ncbi:MAG: NAD(P)/FAD-dependent oxidoreductase [candidate division KSB1 bacterium]|nr:NAD(P)/FAD-dependent oxidoreductase [candidate division KSB1 bacterium]
MSVNKFHTIIVGGGIAGLTSAVYLAREGRNVLLCEKNAECGGLVNSFKRDGFHFDAGVRALEDAGIIFPMLEDLGIQLDVVKSPVSLGIENHVINIENLDSLKQYRELLLELYPESEHEIDAVLKVIQKIIKHMDVLYGIENPVFKDLKHDRTFLLKRLLPWLPKFIFTVGKINRMNMPIETYLDAIIKNPSLKDIISQHFFKNTPTFFALSYFSLYLDYFYPKGGIGKLADALKNKILEYGGIIKTETEIVKVLAHRCRVKDHANEVYEFENLIWAADLKTFYRITDIIGVSPKIRTQFGDMKQKILSKRGGDSVFTLFLEVDEPLESFRAIANGHFFYTPSKQGLGETNWNELDHLLDNPEKEPVLSWLDKYTRLNTYEISIPGLKDPELAPRGETGLIISLLAEYELFNKVRKAGWYDELKTELENRIINVISESIYPMLKDKLVARFSSTPTSIKDYTASSEGADNRVVIC